jgi:pimeloyl-ACP methyl ester carboxylesterase
MRWSSFLLLLALFFGGCSMKQPNTLQNRLQNPHSENIKLHYITKGEGEPLIMIHGFSSSLHTFSHLMNPLSKKYKVYAIDLKGFGASPKPRDDKYSVYDQMVLVKQFMVEHNITNPIMIGHSLGGGVALSLALSGVKIKKMVLIDAAAYKQNLPKLLRWLQFPLLGKLGFFILPAGYEIEEGYKYAFYNNDKIPKEGVEILTKNLQSKNGKYAFAKASDLLIPDDIEEISKQYKTLDIPTLIIWGYNDIIIRKDKAYRLHRDIKNSILKFVPLCGHMPQEECPEETLRLIEDFL